jgi:hypothetical protein
MKILLIVLVGSLNVACSSSGELKQKMIDGAATCNAICKDNPKISEYSQKAGGGIPLLFMGGSEEKCGCSRDK